MGLDIRLWYSSRILATKPVLWEKTLEIKPPKPEIPIGPAVGSAGFFSYWVRFSMNHFFFVPRPRPRPRPLPAKALTCLDQTEVKETLMYSKGFLWFFKEFPMGFSWFFQGFHFEHLKAASKNSKWEMFQPTNVRNSRSIGAFGKRFASSTSSVSNGMLSGKITYL